MTHCCFTFGLTHFKGLSLGRQHLDAHRVCLGELQDPAMAEQIAEAHSSTQQPVSRHRANPDKSDKGLFLTRAAIDRKSLELGEVMRPGNDWHEKKERDVNWNRWKTKQNHSKHFDCDCCNG